MEENKTAGIIMLNNIDAYNQMTKSITGTSEAYRMASTNMQSISRKLAEVKNAFLNQITASDSSNKTMEATKKVLVFVADNMSTLVKVATIAIATFITYKAIIIGIKVATIAYNVALGISIALTNKSAFYVMGNAVAYGAFRTAVVLGNAALWLYNAAMAPAIAATWAFAAALWATGIPEIVLAISALVAVVVLIVKKWNTWGAALAVFTGPLGMVISLIQSFRRNWEMVKKAFSTGGILGGLKAIGKVILDALIMPIQQLLSLVAKIPGMGKILNPVVNRLQDFREGLGVNTTTDESGKPLNAEAEIEKVRTERSEKTINNNFRIGVEALPGTNAVNLGNDNQYINLSKNLGWQN